jgi:hypothetical protein
MTERVNIVPNPNALRVAFIVPSERAFYSDGPGAPKLFQTARRFTDSVGELALERISHESLSDRALRDPEYGFCPTTAVKAPPIIEGVYSYVRAPVGGTNDVMQSPYSGAAWKYQLDEVIQTAEYHPDFIDPIDLLILTEAFAKQVRLRVIDLSP